MKSTKGKRKVPPRKDKYSIVKNVLQALNHDFYYDVFTILGEGPRSTSELIDILRQSPYSYDYAPRTVSKYVPELIDAGLVKVAGKKGIVNVYDLTCMGWVIYNAFPLRRYEKFLEEPEPLNQFSADLLRIIPANFILDLASSLHKWKKLKEEYEIQSKAIEDLQDFDKEILAVTDKVWRESDKVVYKRMMFLKKSGKVFTIRAISAHPGGYLKKIKKEGAQIVIDRKRKFIPMGVLVVDRRLAGIVFPDDSKELNWKLVFFTDIPEEAEKARNIFKFIWNNHPDNPYPKMI